MPQQGRTVKHFTKNVAFWLFTRAVKRREFGNRERLGEAEPASQNATTPGKRATQPRRYLKAEFPGILLQLLAVVELDQVLGLPVGWKSITQHCSVFFLHAPKSQQGKGLRDIG
jgi:hypothetical protein